MSGMAAGGPLALAAMLGFDVLTGGDSTAQATGGAIQTASGVTGMGFQGADSILNALFKNKIGGSGAGKQLQELIGSGQELRDKALGELTGAGMDLAGGLGDVTSGRNLLGIHKALANIGRDAVSNASNEVGKGITNVSKAVSTAYGGGKTGNWAANDLNTIDATSGKKVKIGTYANKSSGDILKQMLNTKQMGRTAAQFKGRSEGAMQMNELLKYYNAALKREKSQK